MGPVKPAPSIRVSYFSDILCVWAYIAQVRVDELLRDFESQIEIDYHFIPVFGVVERRVGDGWKERGGYRGYATHVLEVGSRFPHVEIHRNVWQNDIPRSSANAHLFLKAVQSLADRTGPAAGHTGAERSPLEQTAWNMRLAFFRDGRDVTRRDVQVDIANRLALPVDAILAEIDDGAAMAALCRDMDLCQEWGVTGSPTYVLNEGRQKLYGNVGYRIIAANVNELLHQPEAQASWC